CLSLRLFHEQDRSEVKLTTQMVCQTDWHSGKVAEKTAVVPEHAQLESEAEPIAGPTTATNFAQVTFRERPIPDQLFLARIGRQGERKAAATAREACLSRRMPHARTSSLAAPDVLGGIFSQGLSVPVANVLP